MRSRALLLVLLLVTTGCLTARSQSADTPDATGWSSPNSSAMGAGPSEPVDPQDPRRVGGEAEAHAGDPLVSVALPLVVVNDEGPGREVMLQDPWGRPHARIACEHGACTLVTAAGEERLPGATLELHGSWWTGRATGATLVGPEGEVVATLTLFGATGARLSGPGLIAERTLTPGLYLSGDPRDVDRVVLAGPHGSAVLDVAPGPGGHAVVAGQHVATPEVTAVLNGDPLTDEAVSLSLHLASVVYTVDVATTPATSIQEGQEATQEHVAWSSPLAAADSELLLGAGPVILEGSGTVSPLFDLQVRVAVPNASGYEAGSILVDGTRVASLAASGTTGDQLVFHGLVPGWQLRAAKEADVNLTLVLERDVTPGLVQRQEVQRAVLTLDDQGPAPPGLVVHGGRLQLDPSEPATGYEVQVRHEAGPYRAVRVENLTAPSPDQPGRWTARARGVDDVGNPGPWSEPVAWELAGGARAPVAPELTLTEPRPGASLRGEVAVSWLDHEGIALVRVAASPDGGRTWHTVAEGPSPPLSWDTRLLADGDYLLQVTAEGPTGSTGHLIPHVTVSNLAPATPQAVEGLAPPAGRQAPGTGEPVASAPPLAAALTGLVLLLGVGTGVWSARAPRR